MYVEMTLIHVPFKYSISELYTIPLLFAHLITFVCLCVSVSVSVSVCVHVCVHTYKILLVLVMILQNITIRVSPFS